MRRSDRQITDFNDIVAVMEKCDVCRLGINAPDYPYILPLNYGMTVDDGVVTLYFHGADTGLKYELIAKDNRVSFEMDRAHKLVTSNDKGSCTMEYESVMGYGHIEIVDDDEKVNALNILMEHYHKETFEYNMAVVPQTTVMKLTVEGMTGKQRKVHERF